MQQIYVELSDEITTVIGRIKHADERDIALLVPKGAGVLQSVVNLKLVAKAAKDAKRDLTLITTDQIGRTLATQVGLAAFPTLEAMQDEEIEEDGVRVIGGVKVHRYFDEPTPVVDITSAAPIIPTAIITEVPRTDSVAEDSATSEETPPVVTETAEEVTPQVEESTNKKPLATKEVVLEEPVKPKKGEKPPRKKGRFSFKKAALPLVIILSILVVSGATLGTLYLPGVTVTVTIPTQESTLQLDGTARVDTPADGNTTIAEAKRISVSAEGKLDVQATGKKDVGEKAKGTLELRNFADSDTQTLPAGSRITSGGRTFSTAQAVSVPGFRRQNGVDVPGSATAQIIAETVGEAGNLDEEVAAITSPKTVLSASKVRTSGGSTQVVTIVSDDDITNARARINQELEKQLTEKITTDTSSSNLVSDPAKDSVQVSDMQESQQSGAQVDNFTIQAKATRVRVAVDLVSSRPFVTNKITQSLSPELEIAGIPEIAIEDLKVDAGAGSATFKLGAKYRSRPRIDTDKVQASILGKKHDDAITIIADGIPGATTSITSTTPWWPSKRIPLQATYVRVTVSE
jgi:hypothetical protein